MKRIGTILIILVILYSTYYDLTIGTLPNGLTQAVAEQKTIEQQNNSVDKDESNQNSELILDDLEPVKEIVVEPGQTVLSIVEHLHEGPISPSIQEIVHDFQELNGGIKPEEIQIGKKYFFPLYQ
ncbi:hypothetical protein ACFFHM_24115 [Halalkalibacter kiskunsagensis]|uniref:LysM domain-containing protein n=1 Tax=Halalkalibacter kiskunsagensis TaxID=1548599 RepID=A0ABV6KJK1_9BACI